MSSVRASFTIIIATSRVANDDETNFPEQPVLVDCTLLKVAKRLSTVYIVICLQE